MLAQRGYCIWLCDNRSASQRGVVQSWPVYGHFGAQELRDLEDSINWLKNQAWCDGSRIGIWGWSYGGYLTSYALTHSSLFRAGIAGAPVTDWRNYDAIYTERYMGLPQENLAGYEQSSALTAAPSLTGRLLLIHGDADDNVHLGNTLQLAHRLELANRPFELMIYPQATHGVSQADQVRHLRELMTRFWETNLAN
jgi:dipeptidyl-peptidase-4